MTDKAEIEAKFWKALRSDMTVMLGLVGVEKEHGQPMTAQFDSDEDRGPIWFFTARDSDLVAALGQSHRGVASFASNGHNLFAAIRGTLSVDNDRAMIERLWNPFVAAWYEGGKDDPKLQLLRFDLDSAEIWLNGSSLLAGVKMLLGVDPKADYGDKVAKVTLK